MQKGMNYWLRICLITWLIIRAATAGQAQALDPAFNVNAQSYAPLSSMLVQPDGRCVVLGRQLLTDEVITGNLTRLLPDGSTDYAFQQQLGMLDVGTSNFAAYSPLLARYPDGRLLLVSRDAPMYLLHNGTVSTGSLLRLLPNGRLDSSFQVPPSIIRLAVRALAPQPDGKVLLVGSTVPGQPMMIRLLANGGLDPTFNSPLVATRTTDQLNAVVVQPDGKILVGGSFVSPANAVIRMLPSGALDTGFQAGVAATANIQEIVLTTTGQIILAGRANTVVQGQTRGLHRLHTSGQLDPAFQAPAGYEFVNVNNGPRVQLTTDNRLVVFPYRHASVRASRLLPNGQLDPAFVADANWPVEVTAAALDTAGSVLVMGTYSHRPGPVGSLLRVRPSGALDPAYHPQLCEPGLVLQMAAHQGGVLLAGSFDKLGWYRAGNIGRLLPNGNVDTAFVRRTPALASRIEQMAVQPSGRILISSYTATSPVRNGIVGLRPDGSLDPSFQAVVPAGYGPGTMGIQSTGKIIVTGLMAQVSNGHNVARLLPDGAVDPSFWLTASTSSSLTSATKLRVLPDDKILVASSKLLRLTANGSPDATFQTPELDAFVNSLLARDLVVQPDGRILICGQVPHTNNRRANLIRLLPDGARDTSLVDMTYGTGFDARNILLLPNQRILLGGYWMPSVAATTAMPMYVLNTRGQIDNALPLPEGSGGVLSLLRQPTTGHVYVGGSFLTTNLQMSLARLGGSGVLSTTRQAPAKATFAWPNPVRGKLHVRMAAEARNVSLLTVIGKVIMEQNVRGDSAIDLETSALPAGTYLLRVRYADSEVTRRIVVE